MANEKTMKDSFLELRAAIEAGKAPKNLTAGFIAGAKATLEALSDPCVCPFCAEKVDTITVELNEMSSK